MRKFPERTSAFFCEYFGHTLCHSSFSSVFACSISSMVSGARQASSCDPAGITAGCCRKRRRHSSMSSKSWSDSRWKRRPVPGRKKREYTGRCRYKVPHDSRLVRSASGYRPPAGQRAASDMRSDGRSVRLWSLRC